MPATGTMLGQHTLGFAFDGISSILRLAAEESGKEILNMGIFSSWLVLLKRLHFKMPADQRAVRQACECFQDTLARVLQCSRLMDSFARIQALAFIFREFVKPRCVRLYLQLFILLGSLGAAVSHEKCPAVPNLRYTRPKFHQGLLHASTHNNVKEGVAVFFIFTGYRLHFSCFC